MILLFGGSETLNFSYNNNIQKTFSSKKELFEEYNCSSTTSVHLLRRPREDWEKKFYNYIFDRFNSQAINNHDLIFQKVLYLSTDVTWRKHIPIFKEIDEACKYKSWLLDLNFNFNEIEFFHFHGNGSKKDLREQRNTWSSGLNIPTKKITQVRINKKRPISSKGYIGISLVSMENARHTKSTSYVFKLVIYLLSLFLPDYVKYLKTQLPVSDIDNVDGN